MAGRDFFADLFVASQDPFCLSPEDDLRPPTREKPCSRRLGKPCEGETLLPEVGRRPLRLSPHRGEQEGSCGAGSLQFPRRLTNPRGEGEHRPPAGPPILQERRNTGQPKQTRADDPRPRCGRSWCLSERTGANAGECGVLRFGPVTKRTPWAQAGGPVGRNETPGPSGSPPAKRLRTVVIRERYFVRPT